MGVFVESFDTGPTVESDLSFSVNRQSRVSQFRRCEKPRAACRTSKRKER